jgi:hypothetical protein
LAVGALATIALLKVVGDAASAAIGGDKES